MKTWWIDIALATLFLGALIVLYILKHASRDDDQHDMDDDLDRGARIRDFYPNLIRQCGFRMRTAALPFWLLKGLAAIAMPLLIMEMVQNAWFSLSVYTLPVVLGVVGFFLPDAFLLALRRSRQNQMRKVLSYFVDLLVCLLHSGLPLDRALVRAARDGFAEPNPLADEIMLLAQEVDLGKERGRAFLELARRTGLYEIRGLAGALRIGFEVGAGVVDILDSQADLLRERRRARAIYRITTSTVIATVPVFLCGVPVYLVIVYFPAILKLVELFKSWRQFA